MRSWTREGSNGEGGKKGKKGKKRKREQEGGTFRVAGELLCLTREEAEAHLREALREGDHGHDGMTGMTRGTKVVTKGRGVTRGVRWGVRRAVRRKGTRGVRRGGAGSKDEPRQPPTT